MSILIVLLFPLTLTARVSQSGQSKSALSDNARPAATATTPQLSIPSDPSAVKLSDLAWLEGHWRGEWGPRVAEQVWMPPKAGVMEGMFRLVEADKTLVIEFFTLVQKPDGISFYLRHFTPSLAPWEKSDATVLNLTSIDGKKIGFENLVNGMPKSTTLTQLDLNTYTSHSEIVPETGDPQTIEITYKREPAPNPPASVGSGAHQKKP